MNIYKLFFKINTLLILLDLIENKDYKLNKENKSILLLK